jgi:hypothetical protein
MRLFEFIQPIYEETKAVLFIKIPAVEKTKKSGTHSISPKLKIRRRLPRQRCDMLPQIRQNCRYELRAFLECVMEEGPEKPK